MVTLGSRGVSVQGPEAERAYHVCLIPTRAAQVQDLVARDPMRVCGCGDAFAAGAFACLEGAGHLLLPAANAPRRSVLAAVAGCAAALRWLGYSPELSAVDFTVASSDASSPTAAVA